MKNCYIYKKCLMIINLRICVMLKYEYFQIIHFIKFKFYHSIHKSTPSLYTTAPTYICININNQHVHPAAWSFVNWLQGDTSTMHHATTTAVHIKMAVPVLEIVDSSSMCLKLYNVYCASLLYVQVASLKLHDGRYWVTPRQSEGQSFSDICDSVSVAPSSITEALYGVFTLKPCSIYVITSINSRFWSQMNPGTFNWQKI
jgi:hypothetical protein